MNVMDYAPLFEHFARKFDTNKGLVSRISGGRESAAAHGLLPMWESFKVSFPKERGYFYRTQEYAVHEYLRIKAQPELYEGVAQAILFDGDLSHAIYDVPVGSFVLREGSDSPFWDLVLTRRACVTPVKATLKQLPGLLVQLSKERKCCTTYDEEKRYYLECFTQIFVPSHAPAKVKETFKKGRVIPMDTDHVLLFEGYSECTGRLVTSYRSEVEHRRYQYKVPVDIDRLGCLVFQTPIAVGW